MARPNDKQTIREHYDAVSPYYRSLWGEHIHHGYWVRGDESKERAQLQLMRADVTANDVDDQALLKRFTLFGPPGIVLFDRTGKEVARVVGYESADTFLRSLDRLTEAPQL